MITAPRNLPRFLPTLTEVVQPAALSRAPVAPIPQVDPDVELNLDLGPDLDAIVQSAMQRVTGVIEQRVREQTEAMFRTVVNEQVQACIEGFRQELEVVVRQAVTDTLGAGGAAGSSKK